MNTQLAPIVLFCYNRPKHTEQTLRALSENVLADKSELFVFCDGPKVDATEEQKLKIQEVREVVRSKNWCGKLTVFENPVNKGLANSVIEGVTKIVNEFGRVIVLEDDLITSKYFLEYMNTALEKYKDEEQVVQVSGYCYPSDVILKKNVSFFLPMTTSWGWATWDSSWKIFDENANGYEALKKDVELERKFNLDNTYPLSNMLFEQMERKSIDSWVIRWWWSVFMKGGITLFPDKSLVKNIGFGIDGTHTMGNNPFPIFEFDLDYCIARFPDNVVVDEINFEKIKMTLRNSKSIKNNHATDKPPVLATRVINKLRKIFRRK